MEAQLRTYLAELNLGNVADLVIQHCPPSILNSQILLWSHIEELKNVPALSCVIAFDTLLDETLSLISPDLMLTKTVYRFVDFNWDERKEEENLLVQRVGQEGHVDLDSELIFREPKHWWSLINAPAFLGISCSLNPRKMLCRQFLMDVDRGSFVNQDTRTKDLTKWKQSIPDYPQLKSKLRLSTAYELKTQNIGADWTVDNDYEEHVTLSVRSSTGLEVDLDPNQTKFVIKELAALTWTRGATIMAFDCRAEWRKDYFLDEGDWDNVTNVLDEIMVHGCMDDFFSVCLINDTIQNSPAGNKSDITSEMIMPLVAAKIVIDNYLSDEPSHGYRVHESIQKATDDLTSFIERLVTFLFLHFISFS